ncbi:putative class I glutamine amidotransferase [Myriangium duriaei CBS 260.36]|uniref:Class I glutamine amidotransferase n=1 Tax=Myriangium duriaei CBS 260.36 TaxID=1168546 RepID=A0A9P4J189_9PEZI|nr:putative class I glutamine amidotransferase [Myriangium duriaei CBS 260.36]
MAPLRIAVLECDTPLKNTQSRYHGYGGVFESLLRSGAAALGEETGTTPELNVTKFDVVNAEIFPSLEDVDAILLSGSKHNSFDNDTWILKLVEFTKHVLTSQRRVKVIGVCFGHQIIGRALGAKVGRSDKGWEISVSQMDLSKRGKELFGLDRQLNLHHMHRDIVCYYPEDVEQLGSSPLCEVQGMYAKGRLITVQGHPEFTGDIVSEILESRHASGVFTDGMFEDAMGRVRNKHDGVLVGKAFLKFVIEG